MVDRDLNILFASENMSEQLGPLQVRGFIAVCMGNTVMHWGGGGVGGLGHASRVCCVTEAQCVSTMKHIPCVSVCVWLITSFTVNYIACSCSLVPAGMLSGLVCVALNVLHNIPKETIG